MTKMRIIIRAAGTRWLFTGVGATRLLALADATRRAEAHVDEFVIEAAFDARGLK